MIRRLVELGSRMHGLDSRLLHPRSEKLMNELELK